jgi:hypothetical protein
MAVPAPLPGPGTARRRLHSSGVRPRPGSAVGPCPGPGCRRRAACRRGGPVAGRGRRGRAGVAAQLEAARARADRADAARTQAEAARADADARIAAAGQERDCAIAQARGEVGRRISADEADRDQALAHAARAEQAVRQAQQEASPPRPPQMPPRPRPAGSAPMRTRCGPVSALMPSASGTSCAPICVPALSAPNTKPTLTATNSPAPRPG